MTSRALVPLPNVANVAAGSTAVLSLSTGSVTFHKLQLAVGMSNSGGGNQANTETYVTGIRIKVNGKAQRTYGTGSAYGAAQLDSINAYFNRAFQSRNSLGYIEMFLSEPWRRTPQAEDALAWGTLDKNGNPLQSLTVEIDLAAGITAPTLVAHAVQEYVNRPIGLITKVYQVPVVVSAAGTVAVNSWNKLAGAYQFMPCFMQAATDITSVDAKTDQLDRFNGTYYDVLEWMQSSGWTPQTSGVAGGGFFPIHFDQTGRLTDALYMQYLQANKAGRLLPTGPTFGNFEVDFVMNAAHNFSALPHVLGNPD